MRKLFIALTAGLLVTACAGTGTPGNSERFEQGREAYLAGDYGRAFERLITEAEADHPDAQYTIGYMYYEGLGVSRNEERALEWIRRAANSGSREAIDALGQLASMGGSRPGARPRADDAPAADDQPTPAEPDPDAIGRDRIRDELPEELTGDDS